MPNIISHQGHAKQNHSEMLAPSPISIHFCISFLVPFAWFCFSDTSYAYAGSPMTAVATYFWGFVLAFLLNLFFMLTCFFFFLIQHGLHDSYFQQYPLCSLPLKVLFTFMRANWILFLKCCVTGFPLSSAFNLSLCSVCSWLIEPCGCGPAGRIFVNDLYLFWDKIFSTMFLLPLPQSFFSLLLQYFCLNPVLIPFYYCSDTLLPLQMKNVI